MGARRTPSTEWLTVHIFQLPDWSVGVKGAHQFCSTQVGPDPWSVSVTCSISGHVGAYVIRRGVLKKC